MILIDNIIVADEVVEEDFVCNISKCKGACCWEGDYGAPLEENEKEILVEIYEKVEPYLHQKNNDQIREEGLYKYYEKPKEYGTALMPDGACVFLVKNEIGIASCGIELAHKDKKIDFKKPISCELYPIRIDNNGQNGFLNLIYDKWDICRNLCKVDKSIKIPLYQFVKAALIRKFGKAFYEQLDGAAKHSKSTK